LFVTLRQVIDAESTNFYGTEYFLTNLLFRGELGMSTVGSHASKPKATAKIDRLICLSSISARTPCMHMYELRVEVTSTNCFSWLRTTTSAPI
jgi:hypothetical protein